MTLFDELLHANFRERLADHLPTRVLPISTDPPDDIEVLVDEQYRQIRQLLRPGRRQRTEARAQIRGLLAMEGHVAEGVVVTEKDVTRVEKAIKAGRPRTEVFPRLGNLGVSVEGTGLSVTVKISKREGAPVHFVPADDPREVAAVREIDLQRRYHLSVSELASRAGLTPPKALALRRHLGIDEDPTNIHVFTFGSQKIPQYSDEALHRMRVALEEVDMEEVWERHRPRRRQD